MVLKENIFKRLYIKYQPLFILGLSVFAGFLNYLFQVLAGRYVSPALFGKITVAISVIGILTIPGVAAMKGNAVTVAGTDIQDASFYYRHAVKKLSPLTIIPILIPFGFRFNSRSKWHYHHNLLPLIGQHLHHFCLT